jgi:hypothetical protein
VKRFRQRLSLIAWYAVYGSAAAGISYVLVIKGSPQLHGLILAAVSVIFVLIETVFWKLSDSASGLFETDVLNTRQTIKLEKVFHAVRSMIRRRFITSVALRALAGICAAVLLKPDVIAAKYFGQLWLIAFFGYFISFLAFPTLVVMVRSFSDANDLKRNLTTKESEKKRSDEFRKSLNAA